MIHNTKKEIVSMDKEFEKLSFDLKALDEKEKMMDAQIKTQEQVLKKIKPDEKQIQALE